MATLTDITNPNWSLSADDAGEVVQGVEYLRQNLMLILTTTAGSVPLEPLFGVSAYKYLDGPASMALANIKRDIIEQVKAWEPRIEILSVTQSADTVGASVKIVVTWRAKTNDQQYTNEVNYA